MLAAGQLDAPHDHASVAMDEFNAAYDTFSSPGQAVR
jgi:hypothetical protein